MRAESPSMFEPHDPNDAPSGERETSESQEDVLVPTTGARLDPDDLRSQRFILSLFGYDRAEVRAFLSHLADRLEQSESTRAVGSATEPSFQAVGDEVTRILETATQVAEELQEKLLMETRQAREDAEHDARVIRERAETLAKEVSDEALQRAETLLEKADRRAESLVREATEEAEQIRATESKTRAELASLTELLSGVTRQLESEDDRDH